jgi:hypothetical protein
VRAEPAGLARVAARQEVQALQQAAEVAPVLARAPELGRLVPG